MIPETPEKTPKTPDYLVNPEVEVTILRNATVDLEVNLFGFNSLEVDLEA